MAAYETRDQLRQRRVNCKNTDIFLSKPLKEMEWLVLRYVRVHPRTPAKIMCKALKRHDAHYWLVRLRSRGLITYEPEEPHLTHAGYELLRD
jgi:hypothetical protein